jgi:hypothetical protein
VVAVGPLAEDFEPVVDLGEGAKAKCIWQSGRTAGQLYAGSARSFVEMAPRAKYGAEPGR